MSDKIQELLALARKHGVVVEIYPDGMIFLQPWTGKMLKDTDEALRTLQVWEMVGGPSVLNRLAQDVAEELRGILRG